MAPKAGRGAGAKAKAAAARRVKNGRRDGRRAALALLNALADEVGAVAVQVDVKSAAAADVERTIRVLDARCQQQRIRYEKDRGLITGNLSAPL